MSWRYAVALLTLAVLALPGCQKKCKPGEDVDCWMSALQDPEQTEKAVGELKGLNDKKAEPVLVALFKASADKPKLRETLAEVFHKWQTKAAVQTMVEALDYTVGPNKDGRKAKAINRANQKIASALGVIGDQAACQPLLRLMTVTKESNVQRSTIRALGELKTKDAVEPLLKLVADKNVHPIIRGNAIYALGEIGDERAVQPLVLALYQSKAAMFPHAALALVKIGEPAIDLLVKTMNGEFAEVKRLTEENAEVLKGALEANAAQVLGDIASPKAVEPLLKMVEKVLKWDEAEVNRMVVMTRLINALGTIGDPRGLPVVKKFLDQEFWDVRTVCANAINTISDRSAVADLLKMVGSGQHPKTRAPLIEAIGNLGTEEALPQMQEMLKTEKDVTVTPVVKDTVQRLEAYAACKGSVDCWLGKLADKSAPVREKALFELGRLGDLKALDPITKLLADESENVRWAVMFALDRFKSKKPIAAIEELVEKEKGSARYRIIDYNYQMLAGRLKRAGS